MKTGDKLFDRFWQAYPARNKKKVGKYPCQLWFKAYTPSVETASAMIDWIEQDKANRASVEAEGGFYAPPKDPIRFLKDRAWLDDIGVILNKQQRQAKVRKKNSDVMRERKVSEYINSYSRIIMERTTQQLVNDKIFMYAAKAYPEFRAWALNKRPLLEGARPDKPKADKADNPPSPPPSEPKKAVVKENPPTIKQENVLFVGNEIPSAADLPPPQEDDFTGQSQLVDDFVKKLNLF